MPRTTFATSTIFKSGGGDKPKPSKPKEEEDRT